MASATGNHQKIHAVFDGIRDEQGELTFDSNSSSYLWARGPQTPTDINTSGFAYRTFKNNFILTLQFKVLAQAEQKLCFGLQIESAEPQFLLKTKIDNQGIAIVENYLDKKIMLPLLNAVKNPDVFQVERKGDELIISAANYGKPLKIVARQKISSTQSVNVGVYRHFYPEDKNILELHNLRWVIPGDKDWISHHDYLGSRLELLNIETGDRNIIYETTAAIEAPNWTADGNYIIYNSFGHVYKLHLPTRKIELLNTGFETKNNNDHVISFKGKTLGITHMEKGINNRWNIYKLPIEGGEPQLLTEKSPSFLHGWSPDGRYIIYTGKRNNRFDIYRMASDGVGEEKQLTNSPGINDGAEYSPDGKYIYFNSSRTNTMQIWRMDADGKNAKQLNNDSFNNWFPHVSPDGKQMVFLSYSPDVAIDQHPYYKQVYLRSMPVEGGEPKVVAYLYGGQGTINVPSWSPDGKYVVFVSNSRPGFVTNLQ